MILKIKNSNNEPIALFSEDIHSCCVITKKGDIETLTFETIDLNKGTPHRSNRDLEMKWWQLTSGSFDLIVDNKVYHVQEGDSLYGKYMLPCDLAEIYKVDNKHVIIYSPARKFEKCFDSISQEKSLVIGLENWEQFKKVHQLERS